MGCCETVAICISGVYAIFFSLVGLALVAYGTISAYSILLTNSDTVIKVYGTAIPSIVVASFGVILGILVLLGCYGICRGSTFCVESYSTFLLLLAFAQIGFGGYCVISYGNSSYYRNLTTQINTDLSRAVVAYKLDPQWIDKIQRWVKCCGHDDALNEYKFYADLNGNELPPTCCDTSVTICTREEYYTDACKIVAEFTFVTNFIMGWISIAVGVTEFIASLLGMCLSCCIWRNQMGSWR